MANKQKKNDDPKLGKLLLVQTGATMFRALATVFASLVLWGMALLFLLAHRLRQEVSDIFLFALFVGGFLSVLVFLFGYLKSVKCYERGVVVQNIWKSQSVLFSDVVAIQYLAVHQYTNGIYGGTACHFEVIPRVEASIRVRILGSKRDSNRLGKIVYIILRSNPEAKLLEWN